MNQNQDSDQEINISNVQRPLNTTYSVNEEGQSILREFQDEENDQKQIAIAEAFNQQNSWVESDDEIKSIKSTQEKNVSNEGSDQLQDQEKLYSGSDQDIGESEKIQNREQTGEGTEKKPQSILASSSTKKEETPWVKPIVFKPQQFQMFESSVDKNSIVFLPTGVGKTIVSMMAMQYYLCKYGKGKKIIFLANTVQLVKQQTDAIKRQLPRIGHNIRLMSFIKSKIHNFYNTVLTPEQVQDYVVCLHGEKSDQMGMTKRKIIESNSKQRREIKDKIKRGLIIVMISQMFMNCLRRGYLKISDCMLIVFDECHHCNGEHPFKNILEEFYFDVLRKKTRKDYVDEFDENDSALPYLMGLTASPVLQIHKNIDKIKLQIQTLCNNMNSTFAKYMLSDGNQFNSSQSVQIVQVKINEENEDIPDLIELYKTVFNNPDPLKFSKAQLKIYMPELHSLVVKLQNKLELQTLLTHNASEFFKNILNFLALKTVDIWLELGTYALYKVLEDLLKELSERTLEREPDKTVKKFFDQTLAKYVEVFKEKYGVCSDKNISEKVLTLINILIKEQRLSPEDDKTKKILVFVYERRIVRYLQKIIQNYVENMEISDDKKQRLACKCVTGSSQAKTKDKLFDNIEISENPTNQKQQKEEVALTYAVKFRHQMEDFRETQGANHGLKKERAKKDSRLTRQLGNVNQNYSDQIKTIQDFRKNKFSILLTTSVTEEGFDIPHCNIVVSFNRPQQLKSFIQIKGRARAKNSKYIILELEGKTYQKMKKDKKTYQATIGATGYYAIQKIAQQNYVPTIPPQNPFYKSWKAQNSLATINTNNALQLLMGFVNSHQGLHDNSKMKVYSYFFKTPQTGYTCYLKFHDGLPIDIVKGDICPSKKQAQKSAAFYAAVQLYKKGCIKDDLKPKNFAELEGELDLEKVNDFEIMLSDMEYANILESYSRVEDDDSMKKLKLHFKSLLNKQFDFPFINPQFNPIAFKTKPFTFQLYRIEISNNNKNLKPSENINSNKTISIGLLTCFRNCDTQSIFTNFRYSIAPNINQDYRILLVNETLQLNYQEYMTLKKIHDFIVCSSSNHQLILLAKKSHPQIKMWKQKMLTKKYDFDQREFYPLFVMLEYNKQSKEYQISNSVNHSLTEYETRLQKIYQFQNNYQKTKTKIEPTKFPFDLSEQMSQFSQQYKSQYSNKYIIQSISPDYMLHKCVIVKLVDEDKEEVKELQIAMESKKTAQLRKMYPHAGGRLDKKLRVIILRKILKEIVVSYLCPDKTVKQSMQKEQKTSYRCQFMKYPIGIDVFVQLRFCLDYVLPKVSDYSRAYHFRNIFLSVLESKTLQSCKESIRKYNINFAQNVILQNFQKIRSHMKNHSKSELRQRAIQLLQNEKDYKYPISNILDIIQDYGLNKIPEPQNRDKYIIKQAVKDLNINQILRSLTSKIYKSNRSQNYEEYEFIGDVVLKMLATIQVFVEKEKGDEGELHLGRANIVSNANLREISIRNKLFLYIMTKPLKEPAAPLKIYYDTNTVKSETYKTTKLLMVNSASEQEGFCYIPYKQHADVLEALIGVYYLNNSGYNLDDCQLFLYSLGVLKFPTLMLQQNVPETEMSIPQFKMVEDRLKHKFVNKNLLVQAFTHKSFQTIVKEACDNNLNILKRRLETEQFGMMMNDEKIVHTSMIKPHEFYYERLEFLGDSVLDLVAVQYIYEKTKGQVTQGLFSLLKQVSVSNKTLGLIALFWGFEQFILINSKDTLKEFKDLKERFTVMYENPDQIFTKQAAPLKILGDVLEAYVGAVFLDCQFDYLHTKAICRRMIAPFIDYFTSQALLSKHPQYKFKQYLKNNNLQDVRVKKTDKIVAGGKFEYVLVDRGGNEISRCVEVSMKKAEDLLIEMYMDKKLEEKPKQQEQDEEEPLIEEVRAG